MSADLRRKNRETAQVIRPVAHLTCVTTVLILQASSRFCRRERGNTHEDPSCEGFFFLRLSYSAVVR